MIPISTSRCRLHAAHWAGRRDQGGRRHKSVVRLRPEHGWRANGPGMVIQAAPTETKRSQRAAHIWPARRTDCAVAAGINRCRYRYTRDLLRRRIGAPLAIERSP